MNANANDLTVRAAARNLITAIKTAWKSTSTK